MSTARQDTGRSTRMYFGLTNRTLHPQIAELIGGYTTGQMTYDLRRLRRKGLIQRIQRSQRYELTDLGRMIAVFFTKTHVRIVNPSLAELDPQLSPEIAHPKRPCPPLARLRARARPANRAGRYRAPASL